jgi:glycosyltransferase involved in cell wall biosynthesis
MNILFYSSVKTLADLKIQKFYVNDIYCLERAGHTVQITNRKRDFLRIFNYDCAFIYFFRKGVLPAIMARLFFKKVYFTGGIDDLSLNKKSFNYFLQKYLFIICYFFSNKIFLVSNSDVLNSKQLINKFTDGSKIIYSPHSIYEFNYLKKLLSIPKLKYSKSNVFSTICWMSSVGNVKRKGLDKALYLFRSYLDLNNCSGTLYIIGVLGAGSEFLKVLIDELKLNDNVIFTGEISEFSKHRLLLRSNYYIQLSSYEGFGVAAIEALAHNNIVIHSGKGGLSDTLKSFGEIINIDSLSSDFYSKWWYSFEDCRKYDENKLYKHLSSFVHSERISIFSKFIE